jgi:hypothetical protein
LVGGVVPADGNLVGSWSLEKLINNPPTHQPTSYRPPASRKTTTPTSIATSQNTTVIYQYGIVVSSKRPQAQHLESDTASASIVTDTASASIKAGNGCHAHVPTQHASLHIIEIHQRPGCRSGPSAAQDTRYSRKRHAIRDLQFFDLPVCMLEDEEKHIFAQAKTKSNTVLFGLFVSSRLWTVELAR